MTNHLSRRAAAAALLPLLLPVCSALGSKDDAKPQEPAPLPLSIRPEDPGVRYTGRFDTRDPAGPRCSWSASAISLRFIGSTLNVRLKDSGSSDRWEVIVDGKQRQTLKLAAGSHLYTVFSTSTGLVSHTVELVKRTEGFFGTTQIEGFQLAAGSRLLPLPPRPTRRIEVIGDSITCGYGNEAKSEKDRFSADTENAYLTYGAMAARDVGAEYTGIAWSGRQMWPKNTIDEVYGRTLAADEKSRWDFARWTPDVVVVTLGTNDFAGGIPDRAGWVAGYRAFLSRVRKNYPKVRVIYCATSPMMWGEPRRVIQVYLEQIVQEEREAGHSVRLMDFATQNGVRDGFGADWHPSVKTHEVMAGTLAAALRKDLGWTQAPR